MLVVEDEGLLAELVVALQFVDVGFVVDNVLFVLLQAVHLFLQRPSDVHRHMADLLQRDTVYELLPHFSLLVKGVSFSFLYLHLGLNPGSDDVGLGSKLAPQSLVGLLSGHLLLEHLVSEGHKVLHLPKKFNRTEQPISSTFNRTLKAFCAFKMLNCVPLSSAKY